MASDNLNKLSKLRQGIPPHKSVTINDVEFMVVLLSSDILRKIEEDTNEYACKHPNRVSNQAREQYYDDLLVFHCLRDPDDPTLQTKVASNASEISEVFGLAEISMVTAAYSELMMNKMPHNIELLTQEQFDELKKYLETTPLKDLSTVSLVHLTNFHQAITSGI